MLGERRLGVVTYGIDLAVLAEELALLRPLARATGPKPGVLQLVRSDAAALPAGGSGNCGLIRDNNLSHPRILPTWPSFLSSWDNNLSHPLRI